MPLGPRSEQKVVVQEGVWPSSSIRTRWRDIVAEANTSGEVLVTHHHRAEVVIVSLARYEQLKRKAAATEALSSLRDEFDREMAVLRLPGAAKKLRKLSSVSPERIAAAANAASARRKRR
jgi:prevent-host-death family protein